MTATVIKNTTIVTVGPGNTILHDSAIGIENGRIAALGPSEEVIARLPTAEIVDGRGKAVFPGLVNAHTHLLKTINKGILEDTGFPTTLRFPEDTRSLMGNEEDNVFALLGAIESLRSGATCVLEIEADIANYADSLAGTGMRLALAEYVEDVDMALTRQSRYSFIPAKAEEGMRKSVDLIEAWHGKAEGRVTCMTSPSTPEYCSPELLQENRRVSDRYDIGMTVHLSESYDEVQAVMRTRGVRPTQYLYANGALGPRVVAAHCRYLDESEIALAGQMRTNVSFNPAIAARRGAARPGHGAGRGRVQHGHGLRQHGREHAPRNAHRPLRRARTPAHAHVSPARADAGVGHDGQRPGPWPGRRGREPGGGQEGRPVHNQHHAPPPGAQPPHRFGVYPQRAGRRRRRAVMVDGNWVMRDGKLLTIDEEDVVARAEEMGQAVWRRLLERNPSVSFPFALPPR